MRQAVSDLTVDKQILKEVVGGELLIPARRREAVHYVVGILQVSQRRLMEKRLPFEAEMFLMRHSSPDVTLGIFTHIDHSAITL